MDRSSNKLSAVAWLNERTKIAGRKEALVAGLEACGFAVRQGTPGKAEGVFVTWNRSGPAEASAQIFERAKLPVIVIENSSWSGMVPGHWLHFTRNRHNTAGLFPIGSDSRWDSLNVELSSWREDNGETVALAQRGIGSPPTAMPKDWPARQAVRVRRHPGRGASLEDLRKDLSRCSRVVTWGSCAAIHALSWGIRVKSEIPNWIGEQDNTDAGRLNMFRRLAWAQWRLEEIASGEAFKWMLQ
jgi:hypothetical protein